MRQLFQQHRRHKPESSVGGNRVKIQTGCVVRQVLQGEGVVRPELLEIGTTGYVQKSQRCQIV